jgi:hypothetical protein
VWCHKRSNAIKTVLRENGSCTLACKTRSVVSQTVILYCLCLSRSRIAKRVAELGQLPPREILSILYHPFPHNPHLSTYWVHAIHSIPSQGSILPNALASCELAWSYAIPRRGSSANPLCISTQESPRIITSHASCECASG